jgi:fimbrial isopeptide formation D2 family protein
MERKNKTSRYLSVFILVGIITVVAIALMGAASAKSLYVNRDLNANSPIRAYDIQGAPNYLVFQTDSATTRYGGVGLTIDSESETLFVTFEFSGTLDIVNATTMNVGVNQVTAPGASNLAGIVYDHDNYKMYCIDRNTGRFYSYSWDASTSTLTPDFPSPYYISLTYGPSNSSTVRYGYGLALDEVNDELYVCQNYDHVVVFDTDDWSYVRMINLSYRAMGIALDVDDGYMYTGGWSSYYLSRYDLDTGTETTKLISDYSGINTYERVLGLAVDSNTSLIYATTGFSNDCIMVIDQDLNLLYNTGDIGNPTGIVVPGKEISYNPLGLTKDDGVRTGDCVSRGETFTYTISYNNTNTFQVTGVTITDTLPTDLDYVSNTGGGSYNSGTGTITWNIGTLNAYESGSVTLTVRVNSNAVLGGQIDNPSTINANEPNTGPTTIHEYTPVCNCTGVIVIFEDSKGNPISGIPVKYKDGTSGFVLLGITDPLGMVQKEIPDGTYTFLIKYKGTESSKTVTVKGCAIITFKTVKVTIILRDSYGNGISGALVRFGDSGYGTTDSNGEASMELFPDTMRLYVKYNGQISQKIQDTGISPVAIFNTGRVISNSGTCISYKSRYGFFSFVQNIELLPARYKFYFDDGTLPTFYTIVESVANHIH